MSEYKILLGTKLDTSGLKDDISKLNDKHKIKIGVDLKVNDIKTRISDYNKNTNNIKVKLGVKLDTTDIKKQIDKIGDLNIGNGKGVAIPLNTESLEQSLKEVKNIVESVRKSFGSIDDEAGLKSLLSSVNQIANALDKATDESNGLVKSLNELSKKDFGINIGLKLGGNSISNNAAYGAKVKQEILPELKRQEQEIGRVLAKHFKTDELSALTKLAGSEFGGMGGIIRTLDKLEQPFNKKGDNLEIRMREYQDFFNIIKKSATDLKDGDLSAALSSAFSGFSKSADELIKDAHDIKNGVKETEDSFEKLKSVFNTGIDAETLEPIERNLTEIRELLDNLSKGFSADKITESFREMSNVLDELTLNLKTFQNVVDNSLNSVGNNINSRTKQVVQGAGRLVSNSTQKAIDNVSSKEINEYFKVDSSNSDAFEKEMENLVKQWTNAKGRLEDIKIDTRVIYDEESGANIKRLHQAQVTYNNGLDETIRKTIAWRQIGTTTDEDGLEQPLYGFVEVAGRYSKSVNETNAQTNKFVKQQKRATADLTNQINQLNSAANDKNASKAIKDDAHLKSLEDKYDEITAAIRRMENASDENTFEEERNNVKSLISEYKSLTKEYRNAEHTATSLRSKDIDTTKSTYSSKLDVLISKMKKEGVYNVGFEKGAENLRSILTDATDTSGINKFLNGLDKLEAGFNRASAAKKEFNQSQKIGIDISGLESNIENLQRISPEINRFEAEIDGAKVSVQSLLNDLGQVKTQGDFSVVNKRFKAFENAAEAAGIAVKETSVNIKSIDNIRFNFNTGKFDNDVAKIHDKFDKLSDIPETLIANVREVDNAFESLDSAMESGDADKIKSSYEEFNKILKTTNNELDTLTRKEKQAAAAQKLAQDKETLKLNTLNWMKDNTKATKEYGSELKRLISLIDQVDNNGLADVARQIKNVQKSAQLMGKTGLTVFDKLKAKAKEYASYLSAAELFMYAEQALREMFNTVLEIDTAMTGLYRVTDLTSAEYETLFNNMISSAKEYGATLDDIINATSDWVRAGFDADTALGLAEITTMYQHISDLDYNTAAENLITAYNGFKNELNGAFDGDQVEAVEYIADIFNELDNNFAVTSAGLGEAMTRSASALDLAGNTIQETAGMITGITEVTQDPEKAGSGLKILSLRLRGMKGELEELGEETDENVENISKMQGQILNMTKGKVNIFDASGNFKSTYEIMQGIAGVWDELSSINQADLLETIAGKHRANDVAALLSNWENVEEAVKSAYEAEGSASRENAKYVDSMQGRLDKMTTAWQSFANTFMNSDFLKSGISLLTEFLELLEKLVNNFGTLGTIGLGAGIIGMFKSKGNGLKSGILGDLSSFSSLAIDAISSSDKLSKKFIDVKDAAGTAGRSIAGRFTTSLAGMATGIGVAVAAFGLLYNGIKNYKEKQSEARQETIRTSNEFLDSANSFEQAYIKYSGKTSLTEEEENDLNAAIQGTVDALGDKSSALQNVVNSSNDYLSSLEQIKNAELEAAKTAAKDKKIAAEKELQEAAIGWTSLDGSEVNINFGSSMNEEAEKIAKEIGKKYLSYDSIGGSQSSEKVNFKISDNADTKEIIDYYYMLVEYKEELTDADLGDTAEYEKVNEAIEKMSESVATYTEGLYEAEKASYQLTYGIPKTVSEYLKMRETILKGMQDETDVNTRKQIAGNLDSEYSQLFDLSSAEAQSRQLIGVLEKYTNKEANQMEIFLNMRTAVNNNECTVGDYMSQFENIKVMTKGWSEDALSELNSTFGIDTDAIKKQYEGLLDSLPKTIGNKTSKEFLDGLSMHELSAMVSLETEIDWNQKPEDIIKQIEKEAKSIEAISFDIDLDIETEKLENLTTAVTESLSGSGLSTTSMSFVEDMFGDLDSYDPSKLFERTAHGIRLNTTEYSKLNNEYKKTNLDGLEDKMSALGDKYIETREELSNLTYGTDEYNDKARDLEDIEAQINATEQMAAGYRGLASAYQEWQMAESSGQQRDMYENVIEGIENMEDEISRGWMDDGTIEFLELLSGKDLSTAGIEEQKKAYEKLGETIENTTYSVHDFFTVDDDGNSTNAGVYNFLDAIGQMEEEKFDGKDVVKRNTETGEIIGFDFQVVGGDKAIADALGISEELVQIMVRAADDAGFVVSMDGTYQQLDILKEKAQDAADKLNKIKSTDYKFDLYTGDEGSVLEQYGEALSIWEEFKKNKNADGTIDMTVEGAEDAYTLVSTLQSMVDKLSEPVYMEINATQVEKDMQTPLSKLQEYERLAQQENQLKLKGADTSEIDKTQEEILDYFEGLSPEIKAELGINNLSKEELQKKIEAGEIEIPATIDLQVEMNNSMRDMVNIALYNAGIIDGKELEKRVDVSVYADDVDASDVDTKIEKVVDESDLESDKKIQIKAFAEVFGAETVEDLDKKLDSLTDEQIQIVAEVVGKIDVEKLKTTINNLDDKTVQAIAEALGEGDVEGLKTVINNLDDKTVQAIAEALGYDDVNSLKAAIDNLDPKTVQAIAEALGITDVDSLKAAIDRLTDKDVDAVANVSGEDDVNSLKGAIDNLKGKTITVWASIQKKASDLWDKLTGSGGVDGTAHVDGTTGRAFKQGNWGTKDSGIALGGEEDPELLVRNGRWHLIGEKGAEFFGYKKGDIIFNASQTKEIFEKGKITHGNGRGKALVSGTAFRLGSTGSGGLGSSGSGGGIGKYSGDGSSVKDYVDKKSSSSKSKSTKDEFEETFDWIEVAISRIERAIDQLDQKANRTYKSWSSRNSNLTKEISKVRSEINLQERAYSGYMAEANSVGLSSKWKNRVQDGTIDISTIKDEDLAEKIKNYQTWYEKALACKDAILDLQDTEAELYKQKFDNVASKYDAKIERYNSKKSIAEQNIEKSNYRTSVGSLNNNNYKTIVSQEKNTISQLKKEKKELESALDKAVKSGAITKYSEDWYEMMSTIDDVALSIEEATTNISKAYSDMFDRIGEKYDAMLQRYEHTETMLDEYISQAEAKGHIVSKKYYEALVKNEKNNISTLKKEQSDLIKARDKAVESGAIKKGSLEWYNMCAEIDAVTQELEESTTQLIEFDNAMREIDWSVFDLIQERISGVTAEADFLIELMSNDKLFDDKGKMTNQGIATTALHAQNYNTHMYQADDYGSEVAKLDKQIKKDPYDQELINRRNELIELQRESILAAEDEKQAIVSLIEEGIEIELDALQELIDKKNEELESEKD